jgi:hypothetical protein
MPDPTKFRPIADHHIVRLIHKFNPEVQDIVQEYPYNLISGIIIVCRGFVSPLSFKEIKNGFNPAFFPS